MPTEGFLSTTIAARSGKQIATKIRMISWSEQERRQRAMKVGALGLGLAIAFIFLPIAHFILVPLALLATPFVIRMVFKQKLQIPAQSTECPQCSQSVALPACTDLKSYEIPCDHCRAVLFLSFRSEMELSRSG